MKIQLILITGLILIFSSIEASANYFTPLGGPGVEITGYFAHSGGGVTLFIKGAVLNLDNCVETNRVHLKGNQVGHKIMVSTALAAFAQNRKIGMYLSGCESIPFWGGGILTPIVNNLWVFK